MNRDSILPSDSTCRWVNAVLLAFILATHLGNLLIPAVYYDETLNVNLGATVATLGEYGNTWRTGQLTVPDRSASNGPPITLPVALAWKLGIRGPLGLRLFVVTPFFVGLLLLFYHFVSDLESAARLMALLMFIATPDWGLFSARVLGEFPAVFLFFAGAWLFFRNQPVLCGLLWGLAGITKLVFAPGLALGWALWCLTTRTPWKAFLRVVVALSIPVVVFLGAIWLRYSNPTDLGLSDQKLIVLFYPRNFPLHLASLNFYLPLVLVVMGYWFGWTVRRTSPRLYFLCCLSSFWILWHLLGFQGWTRYVLPGLIMLALPIGASLVAVVRGEFPAYVKAPVLATAAAAAFLGCYTNTYSAWTYFKDWRDQSRVVRFLNQRGDRRIFGEGEMFPYPQFTWLTGRRIADIRQAEPLPGDIVLLTRSNNFLRREMETGRIAQWRFVFSTPAVEIYERR